MVLIYVKYGGMKFNVKTKQPCELIDVHGYTMAILLSTCTSSCSCSIAVRECGLYSAMQKHVYPYIDGHGCMVEFE